MQFTTHNQLSPKDHAHHGCWIINLCAWAHSPAFGYLAGIFLVGALLVVEKVDEFLPQAPLFTGTPFALISILVALLWGMGPALLSLVLGAVALVLFISPGILTPDLLRDTAILGPFLLLQLIAIATVIRLEHARRGLLAAHRELTAANQQLVQATQLKDFVIMRASHELRTPLTTILGRTQLLASRLDKSGDTPENWAALHTYLDVIKIRALHLRALLDSLFDLSRVHTEEVVVPVLPCDLGALCREVVENQRLLSGRSIELSIPASTIMVQADENRLSQVLENLMSNAVKYSLAETPIKVQLSANASHVTLSVHNENSSLTSEHIVHLFDPFYRTPEVEYSSIPGWGLGLTISKEIVERYGGRIWAQASQGNGITFFVMLPLSKDPG